jgi:site-specific DNA recombinase
MPTTAGIYARISADPDNTADGVRRQEAACRKLAASRGFTAVEVYVDNDTSAVAASRPEYGRLLADAAGRVALVIAWTASRLYRAVTDQDAMRALLSATGTELETVKGGRVDLASADGRMRARDDASRAQWELELIKERTLAAKVDAAEQGLWRGGRVPLGYRRAGDTIEPDPETAPVVREAVEGLLAGRPVRAVTRDLNARLGLDRRPRNLRLLLQRRSLAGLVERHGEVVGKAGWEGIITPEESDGVRAILSDPARQSGPGPARRHLGTGLYVSDVDGSPVNSSGGGHADGSTSYAGTGVNRRSGVVDAFVRGAIVEQLSDPLVVKALAARATPVVSKARAELDATRAKVRNLSALYLDGGLDLEDLTAATRKARARIAELEAEVATVAKAAPVATVLTAEVPAAMFAGADLETQRAVVDFMCEVRLQPTRKGRPAGWRPGQPYASAAGVKILWRD